MREPIDRLLPSGETRISRGVPGPEGAWRPGPRASSGAPNAAARGDRGVAEADDGRRTFTVGQSARSGGPTDDAEEAHMEAVPTCGTGLAQYSAIPAKLGDLMASGAEVLELHTWALDLTGHRLAHGARCLRERGAAAPRDRAPAARARQGAGRLSRPPDGRHDREAMAHPRSASEFEEFVKRQEELLKGLQGRLEDRRLLGTMRQGG
jgi:hypothetical protein